MNVNGDLANSGPVIDCDDLATRAAVRSDPARFVESDQPVLIDEYQHVPELLDAIKAQLNRDLRPGRYILAGSTRYATPLPAAQPIRLSHERTTDIVTGSGQCRGCAGKDLRSGLT